MIKQPDSTDRYFLSLNQPGAEEHCAGRVSDTEAHSRGCSGEAEISTLRGLRL